MERMSATRDLPEDFMAATVYEWSLSKFPMSVGEFGTEATDFIRLKNLFMLLVHFAVKFLATPLLKGVIL